MTSAPIAPELKCPCQKCGQNIAFPTTARGQRIDCPHCGWPTLLGTPAPAVAVAPAPPAAPAGSKSPCQFCGQPITFPPEERSTFRKCPHCGQTTILGLQMPDPAQAYKAKEDASTLAGFLILAGVAGFAWFAFGHETSVASASGQAFNNFGLLAQQLGGFIASATAVLSGIGLLILGRLPRKVCGPPVDR